MISVTYDPKRFFLLFSLQYSQFNAQFPRTKAMHIKLCGWKNNRRTTNKNLATIAHVSSSTVPAIEQ